MRDRERVEAVDRSSSVPLARAPQFTTREPERESSGSEDEKGQRRPKKAQNISRNITSTKIQPHRVIKIAARREARVGKKRDNEYQQPDLPSKKNGLVK